ncbi:hypothetical protein [Brumimicrobium aurantiacum]|uniref:Uncharacterized protein n=1 Tax=Brumimicrobium aurantiacum TaxID=1737063 RepID=A0A3E1EU67_9FLAO|nr:hypothetical protein [Brumimicrobium aurantiacum]RFC53101.1 hypothetical protein DXU93_14805 [Brumimicrobium aurantiacum]RFC54039.1 hypothetical protein DXU93_10900 [Brumimicrobium aurantiacum]
MAENENATPEMVVNVKKSGPKFKAGSELASTVNKIDIDWDNQTEEDSGILTVSVKIGSSSDGE